MEKSQINAGPGLHLARFRRILEPFTSGVAREIHGIFRYIRVGTDFVDMPSKVIFTLEYSSSRRVAECDLLKKYTAVMRVWAAPIEEEI